jgi:tetratricopeptide (TPR) repeat protein
MATIDASPIVSAPWKSRPIFVSSSFKDMQSERDHLRSHVFPRLAEALRQRQLHLEPIDLRLGLEDANASEEAYEQLVLNVCFDQIKRSGPYMISLLGDRYGWVPPPARAAAAAKEAGFPSWEGEESVTAMEIAFATVQGSSGHCLRSFFYFRQPLPYGDMPAALRGSYSDQYSDDPETRARHAKLASLKARLAANPDTGKRVYEYEARWDPHTNKVTGLEAWGEQVFQHLWGAIEEDTRHVASAARRTWEEEERDELSAFLEEKVRDFAGREDITRGLLRLMLSPAVEGAPWGACVIGESSSGKSAMFAHAIRILRNEFSAIVLANAAGISNRSTSVEAVLLRRIQELRAILNEEQPLPDDVSADQLEQIFFLLLTRTAAKTRVVVAIDALNRLQPAIRRVSLIGSSTRWPLNARLVVTTLPGETTDSFAHIDGVERFVLPRLSEREAKEIAQNIWGRYHRPLNRAVFDVLASRRLPDGRACYEAPQWINLAVEQLNALGADDFFRADQEFSGTARERRQSLLLDIAARLPGDSQSLLSWFLSGLEAVYGEVITKAFVLVIALSRLGWRDIDLMSLVPRAARLLGETSLNSFQALTLATLRRALRGYLFERSAEGRLDFIHSQMRMSVLQRVLGADDDGSLRPAVHGMIAAYLSELPPSDVIRQSERMFHLIESDDPRQAAESWRPRLFGIERYVDPMVQEVYLAFFEGFQAHYGRKSLFDERLRDAFGGQGLELIAEAASAQATLRDHTVQHGASFVVSILEQPHLEPVHRFSLCIRAGALAHALAAEVSPTITLEIAESVRRNLETLVSTTNTNHIWRRELAGAHFRVGERLEQLGRTEMASAAFEAGRRVAEETLGMGPDDLTAKFLRNDLTAYDVRDGDLRANQGDVAGALQAYDSARSALEELLRASPDDVMFMGDLALVYARIGDLRFKTSEIMPGHVAFAHARSIMERVVKTPASDRKYRRDLATYLAKDRLLVHLLGRVDLAIGCYEAAWEHMDRLLSEHPGDREIARQLAKMLEALRLAYLQTGAMEKQLRCESALARMSQRNISL